MEQHQHTRSSTGQGRTQPVPIDTPPPTDTLKRDPRPNPARTAAPRHRFDVLSPDVQAPSPPSAQPPHQAQPTSPATPRRTPPRRATPPPKSPRQAVRAMQQSFDSYVQPPRPGAAPRLISHDARRRPPRTTANPPTTSPGQRGTTPPPTAHHRAHSRSAVVLLATVLAHATQGRTDAAGPPGLPEWPTTPPPADITDRSTGVLHGTNDGGDTPLRHF